jgi:hypothetical protein
MMNALTSKQVFSTLSENFKSLAETLLNRLEAMPERVSFKGLEGAFLASRTSSFRPVSL